MACCAGWQSGSLSKKPSSDRRHDSQRREAAPAKGREKAAGARERGSEGERARRGRDANQRQAAEDADLRVTRHQEDGQSPSERIKRRRFTSVTVATRCWLLC